MTDYPRVEKLESVTVVLPVINETSSLRETVEVIFRDAKDRIKEFLIVVCNRTTPEAMMVVEQLQKELGELVVVHRQELPYLGGGPRSLRPGARHARHYDGQRPGDGPEPGANDDRRGREEPLGHCHGVALDRGRRLRGYSKIKLICNWIFQRSFSLLYGTHLTDMTYAYRILPTKLVQAIRWEELRHPFLFETVTKPLRLGVPVVGIPVARVARVEGESQNTFMRNFVYFRTRLEDPFRPQTNDPQAGLPGV